MVHILEGIPGFGSALGSAIGGGFSKGVSNSMEMINKLQLEAHKQKLRQKAVEEVERGSKNTAPKTDGESFAEDLSTQGSGPEDPFLKAKKYAALGYHEEARVATEEGKLKSKELAKERESEAGKAKKVLDKVELSRENLIQRRADYKIAEQQIEQSPGDIGSLKNFISDAYHLPGLKSAPAAAFSGVMKDAYIQSLRQIPGTRPNQWIEQQIQTAMPRIGQSDEANKNLLAVGNFKLDLEERYNDIVDALEERYIGQGKKVPGSIGKEAYKLLKPYAEERQKELAYDMRVNYEKDLGTQEIHRKALETVPKGTPLTIEMSQILFEEAGRDQQKAINIAKNLGYEIPDKKFLLSRGYIEE